MTHPWRSLAILLAVLCGYQAWRDTHRTQPPVVAECAPVDRAPPRLTLPGARQPLAPGLRTPGAPVDAPRIYGVKLPPWAAALLPTPGEDLRRYRDRMLPLAQLAIAPQRARVSRSRDELAQRLALDPAQQASLDAAAKDAAQAIEDRLFNAVLSGELDPATFKPMAAVTAARDVLDLVDRANQRFVAALSDAQRGQLARHPFDFADYLVFSTRWEDAISGL